MSTLPIRIGSDDEFRTLAAWLRAVGYTVGGVCERARVRSVFGFPTRDEGRETVGSVEDPLDLLIGLFLDGAAVRTPVFERLVPAEARASLEALGIMGSIPGDPASLGATVSLYPVDSLYVASDLRIQARGRDASEEPEPADFVFSAITPNTGTFLENLPATPCRHLLELCSGTGVAALAGAALAEHAWAVDITERSTRFAEFNAHLNGVENFTALRGDLFEPVRGLTFDRIVAHPPYVPAPDTEVIFRDGGTDGEDILRRILEGLPGHLAPGGCLYATFRATDRVGAPLEDRLRAMIGEREGEFDLLMVTHYEFFPTEYYARLAAAGRVPFSVLEERHRLYQGLDAVNVVYTSIVVQRHTRARPAFTLRRARGTEAGWREAEWLRGWATAISRGDWTTLLLDGRPVLSPHAELHMRHTVEEAEWRVKSCEIRAERPFPRTVQLSYPMAVMLTAYDGSLTIRDQLARLRAAGALAPEMPDDAFLGFLREMVTEGVLVLDRGAR